MNTIYVGDSSDVIKRILTNHCSGNVEGSAFRLHVVETMGLGINKTKRSSGSTRVRINLPDPREGEKTVTEYIRGGLWQYVICGSYDQAGDFQWYVIDLLEPLLNLDRKQWHTDNWSIYQALFDQLIRSPKYKCEELRGKVSGSGVYVFYHSAKPSREFV